MLLPSGYQRAYYLSNPNGAYMELDVPLALNNYYIFTGMPEPSDDTSVTLFGYEGTQNFNAKLRGYTNSGSTSAYMDLETKFGDSSNSLSNYYYEFDEYYYLGSTFYFNPTSTTSLNCYDVGYTGSVSSTTEVDLTSWSDKLPLFGIKDDDGNVTISGNFHLTSFYVSSYSPWTSISPSINNAHSKYFIPCVNADGVAGLYETHEGKFYSSSNGKQFEATIKPVVTYETSHTYNTYNVIGKDTSLKEDYVVPGYTNSLQFSELGANNYTNKITYNYNATESMDGYAGSEFDFGSSLDGLIDIYGIDTTVTSYASQTCYVRYKDSVSDYIKFGTDTYDTYSDCSKVTVTWLPNYNNQSDYVGVDHNPIAISSGTAISLSSYPISGNYVSCPFAFGYSTSTLDLFPTDVYDDNMSIGYVSTYRTTQRKPFFTNPNWADETFTYSIEPMLIANKICYKLKATSTTTDHAVELFVFTTNDKRYVINLIGADDDTEEYTLVTHGTSTINYSTQSVTTVATTTSSAKTFTCYPTATYNSGTYDTTVEIVEELEFPEVEICNVTFMDYTGVSLGTVEVEKGSAVPSSEIPTTQKNGYKFVGWDKDLTNVTTSFTTNPVFEDEKDVIKRLIERGCRKEILVDVIDEDTWQTEYTLTSDDVVAESLEITSSLCDTRQFEFGVCCASELSLQVVKISNTYKGRLVKVWIYLPEGDVQFGLGMYRISSDKFSKDRKSKTLVGYDRMYEIGNTDMLDWYKTTINTKHVNNMKWFIDEFFDELGISYDETSIPDEFAERVVKVNSSITSLSGRQIIENFCEMLGGYGRMTHQYGFEFIIPNSDKTTSYEFTLDDYFDVTREDYYVQKITGVQIVGKTATGFYGDNSSNLYTIKNNIFTAGIDEDTLVTYAKYIYNVVKDVTYVPFTLNTYSHPWVNTCDNIKVICSDGTFYSIIFNRNISGIIGLKDTYSSKGLEYREDEFEVANSATNTAITTANYAVETAESAVTTVNTLAEEMIKIKSVSSVPTEWDSNTIYLIQGEVVVG